MITNHAKHATALSEHLNAESLFIVSRPNVTGILSLDLKIDAGLGRVGDGRSLSVDNGQAGKKCGRGEDRKSVHVLLLTKNGMGNYSE